MSEIPGYREAIALEEEYRDLSFIEAPRQICGVDVQQITIQSLLLIFAIESPFFFPGEVAPNDIARFMWIAC